MRLDAPIAQLRPQLREFPSATSAAGGIQAKRPTPPTARKPTGPTADELGDRGRLRLLQLIRKSGGINVRERSDITGDRGRAGAGRAPGLFRTAGRGIDDIETLMPESGFTTEAE